MEWDYVLNVCLTSQQGHQVAGSSQSSRVQSQVVQLWIARWCTDVQVDCTMNVHTLVQFIHLVIISGKYQNECNTRIFHTYCNLIWQLSPDLNCLFETYDQTQGHELREKRDESAHRQFSDAVANVVLSTPQLESGMNHNDYILMWIGSQKWWIWQIK